MSDEWYFEVESEEYGCDEYGGYDTEEKAAAAIKRVKAEAQKQKDAVRRTFSDPYQGSRHKDYV